jgi:hypothetical protein
VSRRELWEPGAATPPATRPSAIARVARERRRGLRYSRGPGTMTAMHRGRELLACAAVLLCLACADAALGQPQPVTVASGRWNGIPWRLAASRDGTGRFCFTAAVGSRPPQKACANASMRQPERRFGYMGAFDGSPSRPGYIAGDVGPQVTEVDITLSNKALIRTRTIASPSPVADVRFFLAQIPCPELPVAFVARTASGQVAVAFKRSAAASAHLSCP